MSTGKIEPQGWGPILPGLGADAVSALNNRDGLVTEVHLDDGSTIYSLKFCWGRDYGELWEHVYLDTKIPIENESRHFVLTSAITKIVDPVSGRILYTRSFSD